MRVATAGLLTIFLFACGSESPPTSETDKAATASEQAETDADFEQYAAEYQKKVARKTSDVMVNSLSGAWGIPADDVRCVMKGVPIEKLEFALTDPEVQAVFEECGVDPEVINKP